MIGLIFWGSPSKFCSDEVYLVHAHFNRNKRMNHGLGRKLADSNPWFAMINNHRLTMPFRHSSNKCVDATSVHNYTLNYETLCVYAACFIKENNL